ncbi:glycosyltransferase [Scopulibacillus cellulosilyticus]|uniref:Glycosyltransferase n=1 Tax=Scopulibacillus cellulosilyticus TaxID=2665665 RepID=A0ABW2Q2U5_9BACL
MKLLFITKDFSQHIERSSYYLAEELKKHTDLTLWHEHGYINDILRQLSFEPDFILLNDFKPDYCPFIRRLGDSPIPYGIIMHDLKYKMHLRKSFIEQENVRHIFSIYRDPFIKYFGEFQDRMIWFPHHVPDSIFKDYSLPKTTDILMSGALWPHIYPFRNKMYQVLKSHPQFKYIPHPGYQDVNEQNSDIFVGERYAKLINQSKIFLTCDSAEHFALLKYYEVLASGTLLLAPSNPELQELGFEDGKTIVEINEENFMEKIQFYLQHDHERELIVKQGLNMVKERHTTAKRVQEILGHIQNIING